MKKTYQFALAALMFTGALTASAYADNSAKSPKPKQTKESKVTKPSTDLDTQNKKAVRDKEKSQNDLLKESNKGVAEGLKHVVTATKLIEQGKEKEAIKELQAATGKFDIALAANPSLKLIPISSNVVINELITTSDEVKKEVKRAEKLLEDSKVQEARAILLPLRDELVTTTSYLPMQTYPLSIKLATKLLVDGKKNEALDTLAIALTTIVDEVTIMPLPLIRAESMIKMASTADKEKDKKKIHALLNAAQDQLNTAVALGYSSKKSAEYKSLEEQIKALHKEIDGANKVESLYKKLIKSLKDLID